MDIYIGFGVIIQLYHYLLPCYKAMHINTKGQVYNFSIVITIILIMSIKETNTKKFPQKGTEMKMSSHNQIISDINEASILLLKTKMLYRLGEVFKNYASSNHKQMLIILIFIF